MLFKNLQLLTPLRTNVLHGPFTVFNVCSEKKGENTAMRRDLVYISL
jgi:hypothetical protein